MFTITKNTTTGKQEVLTIQGFKTRDWIKNNDVEIMYFDRTEGTKKVKDLRKNTRILQIRKSIILNYS